MDATEAREAMVREQVAEPRDARRPVTDPVVLAALRAVPRHRFVPEEIQGAAYQDRPLPIGEGQTISQPYIVAETCACLGLGPGDRVLEVGLGSGYQAAVLARIADRVVALERIPALLARAGAVLEDLGVTNVETHLVDGWEGWPPGAPYDAIAVACAAEDVPPPLLDQLAIGGRMVLPVGPRGGLQELLRITRTGPDRYDRERLGAVGFVPLVRGATA